MRRVLFVCMGNICRSPTAEGLFRAHVEESGAGDRIDIDSAGTIAHHAGEPPDPRMRQAAAARGWRLEGSARQVRDDDFERFDLIVAMDRENRRDLEALAAGPAEIVLFSDFLPPGSPLDVPDPYYGGAAGFDRVLELVEEGCPALLEYLLDR